MSNLELNTYITQNEFISQNRFISHNTYKHQEFNFHAYYHPSSLFEIANEQSPADLIFIVLKITVYGGIINNFKKKKKSHCLFVSARGAKSC